MKRQIPPPNEHPGYLLMGWAFRNHLGDGLAAACSVSGDNIAATGGGGHLLLPHHDVDDRATGSKAVSGVQEMIPLVGRH